MNRLPSGALRSPGSSIFLFALYPTWEPVHRLFNTWLSGEKRPKTTGKIIPWAFQGGWPQWLLIVFAGCKIRDSPVQYQSGFTKIRGLVSKEAGCCVGGEKKRMFGLISRVDKVILPPRRARHESLWRSANVRNVSTRISLRWPNIRFTLASTSKSCVSLQNRRDIFAFFGRSKVSASQVTRACLRSLNANKSRLFCRLKLGLK